MMSTVSGRSSSSSSKFPFTATQWQELEHQALIYKYMAAGIPIPSDLLFSIRTTLDSSSNPSAAFFSYPHSSPLGWNPYQIGGYGKKIDPEPGRCRRTDGKKWRCSKEAYPDSKYCDRHMHRGKNRSRKPVESPISSSSTSSTTPSAHPSMTHFSSSSSSSSSSTSSSISSITKNNSMNSSNISFASYNTPHHLFYPNSSSSRPPGSGLDYNRERYFTGLKEDVGEHAFFTESSGSSLRGFSGSSDETWQRNCSDLPSGYPYLQLQSDNNNTIGSSRQHQEKHNHQQSFIWGREFNCDLSMKLEDERDETQNHKTIHHFFDEWPPKEGGGRDSSSSWLNSSTTQLSISTPSSSHDFFSRNP